MARATTPTVMNHPRMGEVAAGSCPWCHRASESLIRGWDGIARCGDRKDCRRARDHRLIVDGKRPRSWYDRLSRGDQEALKECRRAGVDVPELLKIRTTLSEEEASKIASVALPDDDES